jgi:hypothetical protein
MALAVAAGAMAAPIGGFPRPSGAALPRSSVVATGTATTYGSTGDLVLNRPLVDLAATPGGRGYWQLGADGGVFAYGDAPFFGSTGNIRLNSPVRSIAPTRGGDGYWFVAGDGGVFNYGRAGFHGSTGALRLNQPVVGMAPTSTGGGYLLIGADGGVFAFGDARFAGSLGASPPSTAVVALTPLPAGDGYWLLDKAGNVYPFGAALALGRPAGGVPYSDIQSTPSGRGFWALDVQGKVTAFGDAVALQPDVVLGPGQRAIALAATPDGRGLWVSTTGRFRQDLATAAGPHDFLFKDSLGRPGRWNPCAPITWYFNPSGAPTGGQALLQEAFDYLGPLVGITFRYGGTTSTAPGPSIQGAIVVGWTSGLSGATGQATASTVATANGPRITSAGIRFDAGRKFATTWAHWGWGPVVLHEMAHALGLAHVADKAQLLSAVFDIDSPSGYGPGDLAGLHRVSAAAGCL